MYLCSGILRVTQIKEFKKKHFKGKKVFWLTNLYQKRVIKCQQASGPKDNVQNIRPLLMKWYAGKNLVLIKVKTDGMLS